MPARGPPGELRHRSQQQQATEDASQREASEPGVQQRSRQAAQRAEDAKPQQDGVVDVGAQAPAPYGGGECVRDGDRCNGHAGPVANGEQWSEQAADTEANHRGGGAGGDGDEQDGEWKPGHAVVALRIYAGNVLANRRP